MNIIFHTGINSLSYTNNSCYQDCVLMSLFTKPSMFVVNEILLSNNAVLVRNELKRIFITIHESQKKYIDVSSLKQTFSFYRLDGMERFYNDKANDAGEFLQYLIALFDIKISPVVLISVFDEYIDLSKYQINRKDYIVFYVQRLKIDRRSYTEVSIPLQIYSLSINSIVVHRNNHYTCYLNINKNWFYYNDISNVMYFIGNFNDVLNETRFPNVKTEGVLYFYF